MTRLTVFLARFIGLFAILLVVAVGLRGSAVIDAMTADVPLMLAYGVFGLALGLAMVVGHNVWRGGLLTVVVTLVGWLITLKSLALLLVPSETFSRLIGQMHYDTNYYVYLVPAFVIGLYLTWAGFSAKPTQE